MSVRDRQSLAPMARGVGALYLAGVVLYILPTILHGNPPIEDAEATLRYVADRGLWRIAHLANIAAVVLWLVALALLVPMTATRRSLEHATLAVWGVAVSVFSVYFGIHAIGLSAVADQMVTGKADVAAILERAEALLLLLGSTAFVAQALLGTSIAMLGLFILKATDMNRVFGAIGIAAGLGWAIGAVAMNFAIIVPFTVLAWIWVGILGARLVVRGFVPRLRTEVGDTP
jgi:hypothetical protein